MHVIEATNVHEALTIGMDYLLRNGVQEETRNGPALVAPGPVTTVYENPLERVVFWPQRDANPFFHLFESLWMLAGRRDVEFVQTFSSKIGEYSDDGETFNAAYGWRWKGHFDGIDQVATVIEALKANPNCRRQVIGIWDASHDLGLPSKDLPCNLAVHFMTREGKLDMTVFNRSNDMIWGAYGANAVHFSFLLELVAHFAGLPVGRYYQVSDNFHAYKSVFDKMVDLADLAPDPFRFQLTGTAPYDRPHIKPFPLVGNGITYEGWMSELSAFLSEGPNTLGISDPFLRRVAGPLYKAWVAYKENKGKEKYKAAASHILNCAASDWRMACGEWINRRQRKFEGKKP